MDMTVNLTSMTVAAMMRTASIRDALESCLAATMSLRAQVGTNFDLSSLKALRGDVIFLDIDTGDKDQMRALAQFAAEAGTAPIVVTAARLDVASMREFMRIGLTDVLPQPLVGQDVVDALRGAAERRPVAVLPPEREDDRPASFVVSFLKSGGGVGATSLAVQAAAALGRDKTAASLCLLDFDIQFGSAALLMDAEQHIGVVELARDLTRFDGALLRGAMVRPYQRFDLLAAPSSIYPVSELDAEAVVTILRTARREYREVIVDLPTLWSDWVLATLANSDAIVLVVQLTVPSLRRAKRQIEMLQIELLDHVPLYVVANRTATGMFGSKDIPLKDAAKALGRAIDATIPDDPAMRSAAEAGQPLSEVRGGRSLEKKIRSMILAVAQKAAASAEPGRA